MKYAIFTHEYAIDADVPTIEYYHNFDIYMVTDTYEGAYCEIVNLYTKIVNEKKQHFLSDNVKGILLTKEYVEGKLTIKNKTIVAYIKDGYTVKGHIDIWIQTLDEQT